MKNKLKNLIKERTETLTYTDLPPLQSIASIEKTIQNYRLFFDVQGDLAYPGPYIRHLVSS